MKSQWISNKSKKIMTSIYEVDNYDKISTMDSNVRFNASTNEKFIVKISDLY